MSDQFTQRVLNTIAATQRISPEKVTIESSFEELGIDVPFYSQRERPVDEVLPWDHIHVKKGREYLAKELNRSIVQLTAMAGAST